MRTILLTATLALVTAACASEPMQSTVDPAMGASAAARHAEMATLPAEGQSAADRHAEGNYFPLR